MVYMTVVSRDDKTLVLARAPGLRAWSTFIGILGVGIGMAVFSHDGWLWKCFCLFCCTFVSFCSLDDWEECVIKKFGDIRLKRFSVIEKVLRPRESQREIVVDANSIVKAEVESENIRFFGTGRVVMLHFSEGYTMPLTEKCTLGDGSDHQQIANVISDFLELHNKQWGSMSFTTPGAAPSSSSSSSSEEEEEEEEEDKTQEHQQSR